MKKKVTIKLIASIMVLAIFRLLFSSFSKSDQEAEAPIDKTWWADLSDDWKDVLLVNQNFSKHRVNIFKLQTEYINRLKAPGEKDYSEMNKPLYELDEMKRFGLSYDDLYKRAIRNKHTEEIDSIDLTTLADLDVVYMVNGPSDLTPLKKFNHLKVLILNFCGRDNDVPVSKQQPINLEPLKGLKELQVLHCYSSSVQSLSPIKNLVNLRELDCSNSSVTTLDPVKDLVNLEKLAIGSKITNADAVSRLVNLEELNIRGCKQLPDLSKLKKLKKLSIAESEMAIVDRRYRVASIDFLRNLTSLEFLDLGNTSYKDNLQALAVLPNLKAVMLPRVSDSEMLAFKNSNKNCVIINSYQF